MNANEIKKELYRNKPTAKFSYIRKGHALYKTILNEEEIYFNIPIEDIGDATYYELMESHLLIRYLVLETEV
jgi:hypothetical protein